VDSVSHRDITTVRGQARSRFDGLQEAIRTAFQGKAYSLPPRSRRLRLLGIALTFIQFRFFELAQSITVEGVKGHITHAAADAFNACAADLPPVAL